MNPVPCACDARAKPPELINVSMVRCKVFNVRTKIVFVRDIKNLFFVNLVDAISKEYRNVSIKLS